MLHAFQGAQQFYNLYDILMYLTFVELWEHLHSNNCKLWTICLHAAFIIGNLQELICADISLLIAVFYTKQAVSFGMYNKINLLH